MPPLFYKRGIKNENPVIAMSVSQYPVIAMSVSQYPVIARSVSDEAISLLKKGN